MKFRHKIAIAMLCLLSIIYGVSACLMITFSYSDALEHAKETAHRSYSLVVNVLHAVNEMDDNADISNVLEQISVSNASWTSLQLSSSDGTLYTYGTPLSADTQSTIPENSLRMSLSHGESSHELILTGSVQMKAEQIRLDMVYDVTEIHLLRQRQQEVYRSIFLAMLTGCAVLAYSIAWGLTRPLAKLSIATRELAAGNLNYRFDYSSKDEIGQVAGDFNKMARQVEKSVSTLHEDMERQKRFMGSFAHEIKTPMTSVIGYADLLRNGMLDKEEGREAANYIFTESKRLEHLSLKLLELLAVEHGDLPKQEVNMRELIEYVVQTQKKTLQNVHIGIRTNCDEGLCVIEPDLVSSLLINLLDNARKAIGQDGEISVSCRMTDRGCILCINDNGRGIPKSAIAHLEEAFYRVDKARSRQQGGAGLGLTLCHEIAKFHNGSMHFESKEGTGTCVVVELNGGRA